LAHEIAQVDRLERDPGKLGIGFAPLRRCR
jgi:hypothetical protein